MSSEIGLRIVVGWSKWRPLRILHYSRMPSYPPLLQKDHCFQDNEDDAQDHGEGIEKTIRIPRLRISVSRFIWSSATVRRKGENPQSELHSNGCCSAILEVPFYLGPVDGKENRGGVP